MTGRNVIWILAGALGCAALLATAAFSGTPKEHRLVFHVSKNDPVTMNMALSNAQNAVSTFTGRGEKVEVEFVAIGPGLHMLREDTSPVKARIAEIAASTPSIRFSACANTRAGMAKAEGEEIVLVPQAVVVPAGIVRLTELEEQGWTYVRP